MQTSSSKTLMIARNLILVALATHGVVSAQVTFYLSPSGNPNGNQAWLAAASNSSVTTVDFDWLPACASLDSINLASMSVGLNLLESNGSVMQWQGAPAVLRTWGVFGPSNGAQCAYAAAPGTIWQTALVNGWNCCSGGSTGACSYRRRDVRFTFSRPVPGFGLWLFDDVTNVNHAFTMRVELANGHIESSAELSNPCTANGLVEGFIGVHSSIGISVVVISSTMEAYYEMDNIHIADWAQIGTSYCSPAVGNSTGQSGLIRAFGSNFVLAESFRLAAEQLPLNSFGFFITSRDQGSSFPVVNSQGRLCLDGAIGRFVGPGQTVNSGTNGRFSLAIDTAAMPTPSGPIAVQPGQTWNFQAWYRDANPSVTSNFTDAVSVTFQ